jgi:predicted molibdopterin-dependent oxidoreductase YjgC
MKTVTSICAYCGCSCKLNFVVEKGKLVKVLPDNSDEVSEGKPCIKGLTLNEVIDKGRILKPMIRKNKMSKLKEVSWQKAYDFIYKKTKDLAPDEIFFVPSGKITNEDNFAIQKFARIVFKTNNIDGCCSRLCHIATVKGLIDNFGNGAIPSKMNDIYSTDCLFIIGSNPASNYPVIFDRILKSKKKGMKVISVQAIMSETSGFADLSVTIQPGSELVLLNGLINLLIESKAYDKKVEQIEGFKELRETVKDYSLKRVCEICGVREKDLNEIVDAISKSKSFGAIHGMGLTQHINALENVHNLLNLLILKNGKLLSCRGEVNVQGVGDMGCVPYFSPIDSLIGREKLEKYWKTKIPIEKGESIIESFLLAPVKASFISGFNPAQSLPNLDQVHKNLKKMFLIANESYFNLTTRFVDVVLPTPTLMERNGTITNGERRVRLVRKVVEPLGNSKTEWMIIKDLSKIFGYPNEFDYKSEKEIFKEIVNLVPAYKNIDVNSVYNGNDAFADKEINFLKFIPEQFEGADDVRSEKYPFILTTFRSAAHFLTNEMTSKSKTLNKFPEGPFCYLNRDDANKLKVKDGDKVRVSSHVSSLTAKVKADRRIPKGIVGMHFHFEELLVNKLFPTQFDEETFTPNYKLVAIKIERLK